MEFILGIACVVGCAVCMIFAYVIGYKRGLDDRSEDFERRHAQDKTYFAGPTQ